MHKRHKDITEGKTVGHRKHKIEDAITKKITCEKVFLFFYLSFFPFRLPSTIYRLPSYLRRYFQPDLAYCGTIRVIGAVFYDKILYICDSYGRN